MRMVSSSSSTLPLTTTIAPRLEHRRRTCRYASGKITTSTLPWGSSSMMTAMRSPLRVFSWRIDAMMPPIATSTPRSRFGSRWPGAARRRPVAPSPCARRRRLGQLRRRLRAEALQLGRDAIDRMPAEVEAERFLFVRELLRLRSTARRSHGPVGRLVGVRPRPARAAEQLRLTVGRDRAAAARRTRTRDRSSPSAARAARRSDRVLCRSPNESNAPALTRLSSTRLLTSRRSSSSHSACSDVIFPCVGAHAENRRDRALADVLDRRQAEAHALPASP